jgi:error-prone DNA polymerase
MVSEVISYRGKSALREVGKVFGLSLEQLDRLSGLAVYVLDDHADVQATARRARPRSRRPPAPNGVELADEIQGFPRHLSIHVGGFVLSAEPLDRVAPVEPARMEAAPSSPGTRTISTTLGFFKVDVLGLGMLTPSARRSS